MDISELKEQKQELIQTMIGVYRKSPPANKPTFDMKNAQRISDIINQIMDLDKQIREPNNRTPAQERTAPLSK